MLKELYGLLYTKTRAVLMLSNVIPRKDRDMFALMSNALRTFIFGVREGEKILFF